MKAEIIGVGSELLLGQIVNTNAQFISARLAEVGIDVLYHSVVGDNSDRLERAIEIAQSRADVIIFTGGLGPTKDDMTKQTVARMLGQSLRYDERAMNKIKSHFERQQREMPPNNTQQALVLEHSTALWNERGMAPGMAITEDGITYILLPGPPHEMKTMFDKEALPYLLGLESDHDVIISRVLNFYGIGESDLETRIESILDEQTNPTIAPLASPDAVTIRMTAKAKTEAEAYRLIEPVEAQIRARVGDYIFGVDEETLASRAIELLRANGLTISAAESLTAGLFTSELATVEGTSDVLKGSFVTYSLDQKVDVLGVDRATIEREGVVSSYCAQSMAVAVRKKTGSDVGVGLTGAAGPDSHDGAPAGTVWIGIATPQRVKTYRLQLSGLRNANRRRAANFALYYVIRQLKEEN